MEKLSSISQRVKTLVMCVHRRFEDEDSVIKVFPLYRAVILKLWIAMIGFICTWPKSTDGIQLLTIVLNPRLLFP
jgi:hypothetical protein